MFKVIQRLYGSNGATQDWGIVFDVETQEEIVQIMKEVDEEMILVDDHEKVVAADPFNDDVLDAGGLEGEFFVVYRDGEEIEPIDELVEIFS